MIFGDLDVTWSAVGHVLPASVLYDVLLSPFVLYAVIRARALAAPALDAQGLASFPGGSASQRVVPGLAGAAALFSGSGAVLRDSGTGRPEAEGPDPAVRAPPGRVGHRDAARAAAGRAGGARELQRWGGRVGPRLPARERAPSRPVNLHLGRRGEPFSLTRPQGSRQGGGGMPAKAFSRSGGASGKPSAGAAPWAMAAAARPCARRRGVPGSRRAHAGWVGERRPGR